MGNKESFKLVFSDSINFDTVSITKEYVNFVDQNDGSAKDIDLPFIEFDPTLKANLSFRSESCVKAFSLQLGVEELRGVLHYQIMQQ